MQGNKLLGALGVVWGTFGFVSLLGCAVYRLTPYAVESFQMSLTPLQWAAMAASILFMGYTEGYKTFQKKYSPRAAARLKHLFDHPRVVHVLLAPFFIMCFFYTTRKRKIVSYSVTFGIILLVVMVRKMDQPWRGIVDAGVVLGLSWGILSYFINVAKAFCSKSFDVSPELPTASSS